MKVYLYTFKDNDTNFSYHLITTEDKGDLISNIENYYYDFKLFDCIKDLLDYLKYNGVHPDLFYYLSLKENIDDLVTDSIFDFTVDVLKTLNVLVDFENKTFTY